MVPQLRLPLLNPNTQAQILHSIYGAPSGAAAAPAPPSDTTPKPSEKTKPAADQTQNASQAGAKTDAAKPATGNEAQRFLGLSGEDWHTVGATIGTLTNLLGGGNSAERMQAPGLAVSPVPALQLMGLDTSPGRLNVATNFGVGLPYASTSGVRGM
jgi:hypothetical protein